MAGLDPAIQGRKSALAVRPGSPPRERQGDHGVHRRPCAEGVAAL